MAEKIRLDMLLFQKGLLDSREKAKAVIMSGSVYVNGARQIKPGVMVDSEADIQIKGGTLPYVSRGGLKLEKALDEFNVSPEGLICIDCGASTGGFTDCLLQRGASKVYSVDVGYGQFDWKLRNDPRVVLMERTNVRHLTGEEFGEKPELAVVDVSFISLKLILPVLRMLLEEGGQVLCLIKPQFEAGRDQVGKKGVVRDQTVHKAVLESFVQNAKDSGFGVSGITYSPIKGPEGNIEFLGHLVYGGAVNTLDVDAVVAEAHKQTCK